MYRFRVGRLKKFAQFIIIYLFVNNAKIPYLESRGALRELNVDNSKKERSDEMVVPCFPFETLLLALNRTTVDYFSLDVEGFELDILKTIPFDRLDITLLSVEYVHGRAGKEAYKQFMTSKGYSTYRDIHLHDERNTLYVDDFIFVKNWLYKKLYK